MRGCYGLPVIVVWLYLLINFAQQYTSTSNTLILIHQLQFNAADINLYYGITFAMWTIRPIYAYISDNIVLCGGRYGRRQPYILIGLSMAAAATALQYIYLEYAVQPAIEPDGTAYSKLYNWYVLCSAAINCGLAIASMCVDSVVVEMANQAEYNTHNACSEKGRLSHEIDEIDGVDLPLLQPTPVVIRRVSVESAAAADPSGRVSVSEMQSAKHCATTIHSTIQSRCMLYRTCGSTLAAALSIASLYVLQPNTLIAINTLPSILAAAATMTLQLPSYNAADLRVPAANSVPTSTSRYAFYRDAVTTLWRPMLFLFLYNLLPSSADAYNTYLYTQYKDEISAWQYSTFDLLGLLGGMTGVMIYTKLLTQCNLHTIFALASLLACIAGMSQLTLLYHINTTYMHIPNAVYVPLLSLLTNVFDSVSSIPPVVLASQSCPSSLQQEGTMFSLYQGCSHLASLLSALLAATFASALHINNNDYSNLPWLIITCHCLAVTPVLLLPIIRK